MPYERHIEFLSNVYIVYILCTIARMSNFELHYKVMVEIFSFQIQVFWCVVECGARPWGTLRLDKFSICYTNIQVSPRLSEVMFSSMLMLKTCIIG